MRRVSTITGWGLLLLGVTLCVSFVLLALVYLTGRSDDGLRALYDSSFSREVTRRVERIEEDLDFSNPTRLRGIISSGEIPEHDADGVRFEAFSARWSGSISIPSANSSPNETQTDLSDALLARVYAGHQFEGRPIAQFRAQSPGFDGRNPEYASLPSRISIEWIGSIRVDDPGEYALRIESDGDVAVFVDNIQAQTIPAAEGDTVKRFSVSTRDRYQFRLRYVNQNHLSSHVALTWRTPESSTFAPIPAGVFLSPVEPLRTTIELETDAAQGELDIAGRAAPGREFQSLRFVGSLLPGSYPVSFGVQSSEMDIRVRLMWVLPDGTRVVVPTSATSSGEQSVSQIDQLMPLFWLFVAYAVLLLFWMWCVGSAEARRFFLYRLPLSGLMIILALSAYLRLHDYQVTPPIGGTRDELNEGWIGWSLLHTGIPTGWSLTPAYNETKDVVLFDRTYPTVTPAFHPPPLFPLLLGAAATLGGADEMLEVSLKDIRLVPIACSLGVILLVWLIAHHLWGAWPAFFSAAVISSLPVVVLLSRLAKDENLLVLLMLFSIWSVLKLQRSEGWGWLVTASVTAGLCALTKPTGLSMVVALVLLFCIDQAWRRAFIAGITGISIALLYPLYGWFYDWELFVRLFSIHGSMVERFDVASDIVGKGAVVAVPFGAGWLLWLWFSGVTVAKREALTVLIPIGAYLVTVAVSVDSFGLYGWYRIPFFPLLAIMGGLTLHRMWLGEMPHMYVLFVLLFAGCSATVFLPEYQLLSSGFIKRGVGLMLLPVVAAAMPWRSLKLVGVWGMRAVLLGVLLLNAWVSFRLPWYYPVP